MLSTEMSLGLSFKEKFLWKAKKQIKCSVRVNCKARVAYLNGSKVIEAPPVELIQFVNSKFHKETIRLVYDIYLGSMLLHG